MTYLNQDEVKALLAAPSARHRLGLRDRALLTLPCNTGARATEVVQLNIKDLRLETPSQVRILGKGRKERICPLWQETSDALRGYLRQRADGAQPDAPLFLNAHGERISRFVFAVAQDVHDGDVQRGYVPPGSGKSILRAIRRRWHRRTVPGVTSRCTRSLAGRSRMSAARTARSAQSSRARGLARRSTATSCRSTSSSAFLEAGDRPSRISQPQTRTKMR